MIEETNSCGPCADSSEVSSADPGLVFRYNTLDGNINIYNQKRPDAHATIYGNIFLDQTHCDTASTYSYNVFPAGSAPCGTHGKSCTPRLAKGDLWTNMDMRANYHLSRRDNCARTAGDARRHPQRDIDGQMRPHHKVSAGADQVP